MTSEINYECPRETMKIAMLLEEVVFGTGGIFNFQGKLAIKIKRGWIRCARCGNEPYVMISLGIKLRQFAIDFNYDLHSNYSVGDFDKDVFYIYWNHLDFSDMDVNFIHGVYDVSITDVILGRNLESYPEGYLDEFQKYIHK
jgi:hypothetical protein